MSQSIVIGIKKDNYPSLPIHTFDHIVSELKSLRDDYVSKTTRLGEIRATLIVNFGEEGKSIKGILKEPYSKNTFGLMIQVLEYLTPFAKQKGEEIEPPPPPSNITDCGEAVSKISGKINTK